MARLRFEFMDIFDGHFVPYPKTKFLPIPFGEDGFSTTQRSASVSDGVGGCIFPSKYISNALALNTAKFALSLPPDQQYANGKEFKGAVLKYLLPKLEEFQSFFAQEYMEANMSQDLGYIYGKALFGLMFTSATFVHAQLEDGPGPAKAKLRIFQKGDSATAVFRRTANPNIPNYFYYELVFFTPEQQAKFNTPYQFTSKRHFCNISDNVDYDFDVEEGDIVVVGSDGVFDNVFLSFLTYLVNLVVFEAVYVRRLEGETFDLVEQMTTYYFRYLGHYYEGISVQLKAQAGVFAQQKKERVETVSKEEQEVRSHVLEDVYNKPARDSAWVGIEDNFDLLFRMYREPSVKEYLQRKSFSPAKSTSASEDEEGLETLAKRSTTEETYFDQHNEELARQEVADTRADMDEFVEQQRAAGLNIDTIEDLAALDQQSYNFAPGENEELISELVRAPILNIEHFRAQEKYLYNLVADNKDNIRITEVKPLGKEKPDTLSKETIEALKAKIDDDNQIIINGHVYNAFENYTKDFAKLEYRLKFLQLYSGLLTETDLVARKKIRENIRSVLRAFDKCDPRLVAQEISATSVLGGINKCFSSYFPKMFFFTKPELDEAFKKFPAKDFAARIARGVKFMIQTQQKHPEVFIMSPFQARYRVMTNDHSKQGCFAKDDDITTVVGYVVEETEEHLKKDQEVDLSAKLDLALAELYSELKENIPVFVQNFWKEFTLQQSSQTKQYHIIKRKRILL